MATRSIKPLHRVGPKPRKLSMLEFPTPMGSGPCSRAAAKQKRECHRPLDTAGTEGQIDVRLTIPLQCLTNLTCMFACCPSLGLRAARWVSAFAEPQLVANSMLAGSKFSNVHARNMLYGILEEVHRAGPLVRVDQRVDDLAQCAVGRQTAVIEQMVEAAEIITFACDRVSLVISPESTTRCPDVGTQALLRRGLLERWINVGFTTRTRDLGVDTGGGSRRSVGVMKWAVSAPSTIQGIRTRAEDAVCPESGRCENTSSIAIGLPYNADPVVQAGIEGVKQWLVFWQNSDEYVRTRVRRAWRLSPEQLRDGSRWLKVRGPMRAVMCVLFDAALFIPRTGNRLVVRVCTGLSRVWVTRPR